jgi:hypothetical protein
LVLTFDCGGDPVCIGGPCRGLGVGGLFGDEAVDGGLKIDERVERAALQASFSNFWNAGRLL